MRQCSAAPKPAAGARSVPSMRLQRRRTRPEHPLFNPAAGGIWRSHDAATARRQPRLCCRVLFRVALPDGLKLQSRYASQSRSHRACRSPRHLRTPGQEWRKRPLHDAYCRGLTRWFAQRLRSLRDGNQCAAITPPSKHPAGSPETPLPPGQSSQAAQQRS
jgi:hypothetical protein